MRDAPNDQSPRMQCSILPRKLAGSFAVIAIATLVGAFAQDGRVADMVDQTVGIDVGETVPKRH